MPAEPWLKLPVEHRKACISTLGNGAAYLIRPDGYVAVAVADANSSPAELESYLDAQLPGSSPAVRDAEG